MDGKSPLPEPKLDNPTLAELELFAGIDEAHLTRVRALATLERVVEGESVLEQGGPATDLRVILRGKLQLGIEIGARHEQLLMTLRRNEIVGWSALLDRQTWFTSAVALRDTFLLRFSGTKLRELCRSEPVIGYHIMHNLFAALAARLQDTRLQLIDMYGGNG